MKNNNMTDAEKLQNGGKVVIPKKVIQCDKGLKDKFVDQAEQREMNLGEYIIFLVEGDEKVLSGK